MDKLKDEDWTAQVGHFGDKGKQATLRWFEHLQRRDGEYIGKRTMKMESPGRRQRRKPKRRFLDVVKMDMQVLGVKE